MPSRPPNATDATLALATSTRQQWPSRSETSTRTDLAPDEQCKVHNPSSTRNRGECNPSPARSEYRGMKLQLAAKRHTGARQQSLQEPRTNISSRAARIQRGEARTEPERLHNRALAFRASRPNSKSTAVKINRRAAESMPSRDGQSHAEEQVSRTETRRRPQQVVFRRVPPELGRIQNEPKTHRQSWTKPRLQLSNKPSPPAGSRLKQAAAELTNLHLTQPNLPIVCWVPAP